MSDHKRAIVPLESWSYASPEIRAEGNRTIDVGLFAEALLYYDVVAVHLTNQPQLAEFLKWFIDRGCLEELLVLMREGVVQIYDYSFSTAPILGPEGRYSLWNVQDPIQAQANTFEQRFLYHPSVEYLFPKARQRLRIYQAFRGSVIEVKSEEFGVAIENARLDWNSPERHALAVQIFVDELYRQQKLGHPPLITAKVQPAAGGSGNQITWNVDFNDLKKKAGPNLNFGKATPLTAIAHANRFIWSAAKLSCDLYLPQPMGMLVGDKLYESAQKIVKTGALIEELKDEVEFPSVRELINADKIVFKELLKIRHKAKKFRDWLQQEAERDRNAIIAYHNEVAKECGLIDVGRKGLALFGLIGGNVVGTVAGTAISGLPGIAVGAAASAGTQYLIDLVAKMGADWKPVVFGNWFQDRIKKLIEEEK